MEFMEKSPEERSKTTMAKDVRTPKTTAPLSPHRRMPRRAYTSRIGLLAKGKYHLGRGLEVGEGGMLFEGVPDLTVGQKVVITFQTPGAKPTVVQGVVHDIQEKRAEVKFLNLDFNIKRAIRTFVASKTAEEDQRVA